MFRDDINFTRTGGLDSDVKRFSIYLHVAALLLCARRVHYHRDEQHNNYNVKRVYARKGSRRNVDIILMLLIVQQLVFVALVRRRSPRNTLKYRRTPYNVFALSANIIIIAVPGPCRRASVATAEFWCPRNYVRRRVSGTYRSC